MSDDQQSHKTTATTQAKIDAYNYMMSISHDIRWKDVAYDLTNRSTDDVNKRYRKRKRRMAGGEQEDADEDADGEAESGSSPFIIGAVSAGIVLLLCILVTGLVCLWYVLNSFFLYFILKIPKSLTQFAQGFVFFWSSKTGGKEVKSPYLRAY